MFAWEQEVRVSMTDLGENELLVTVTVQAVTQATLTEGGQQRKLVQFVFQDLVTHFPQGENQPSPVLAPGTSGCFGIVMAFIAIGWLAAKLFA